MDPAARFQDEHRALGQILRLGLWPCLHKRPRVLGYPTTREGPGLFHNFGRTMASCFWYLPFLSA
jgi:hypothetical protein